MLGCLWLISCPYASDIEPQHRTEELIENIWAAIFDLIFLLCFGVQTIMLEDFNFLQHDYKGGCYTPTRACNNTSVNGSISKFKRADVKSFKTESCLEPY